MIVQRHFKKFPRCARLGAMLRKISISRMGKIRSHGWKFQHIYNLHKFSALRAVGGDVEIFRTKFIGDDRDEKIDFRRVTSRVP